MGEGTRDEVFDKPMVYEESDGAGGERVVYRASSLGGCMGALVRTRMGMTPDLPPDLMLERYQEGIDWEGGVIAQGLGDEWAQLTDGIKLSTFGKIVEVEGRLQVEVELAWSNKVVRCHPDAIAIHRQSGKIAVVEAKFLGESMFAEKSLAASFEGPKGLGDMYAWQVAVEMLATGLPMLYLIGKKKIEGDGEDRKVVGVEEVIPYLWEVGEEPWGLKDVKARVLAVEGYAARGEVPACPLPFMYPCGFWRDHDEPDRTIEDERLEFLVESYARAKANEGAHRDEGERIKKDVDARLRELGVKGGECGGWEIARVETRPGNVSWASAYKALSKQTGERVDEEKYRGKEIAGGVRMTKKKDEKGGGE